MPKVKPGGLLEEKIKRTKERLLVFLARNNGLIYISCRKARVDPMTYYNYLNNDPEFKRKVQDIREGVIDWAESKLMESIKEGQYVPNMFYLKTQAKHRGYIENQQMTISGDKVNPLIPDSTITPVVLAAIEAERQRLSALPAEDPAGG